MAGALISQLDPNLLMGLLVATVFSIAVSLFRVFRRDVYVCPLTMMAALLLHGSSFPGFVIVTGIAYISIRWLSHQSSASKRWRWACVALLVLVIVFTLGRVAHWNELLTLGGPVPIVLYGLDMWLALRLVILFWEVGSGNVAVPPLSKYIIWVCLPFTIIGPLLRLSEMPTVVSTNRHYWITPKWWLEGLSAASKFFGGTALTVGQHALSSRWPEAHLLNHAASTFLTGPVSFYLTTAGYMHIMQVLGRPAGFKLQPSFNSPIGRENISAFWMNWNMTATFVFRDLLFYNRWGRQTYNIYFNAIVLFTLVGLWHAANAYWVLWGFLNGLLFCTFLLWRKHKRRVTRIPLSGSPVFGVAARVFTYGCVCMTWYLPSKILQKAGFVV